MNARHSFVTHVERHQKPFSLFDGVAKTVFDGQVKLCDCKQAMEDIFELGLIQILELVGGDDLHISQEVGSVLIDPRDTRPHFAARDTNFVNPLAVRSDKGMGQQAAQHVNRPCSNIVRRGCTAIQLSYRNRNANVQPLSAASVLLV
jgi:hypothetical protein